MREIKFRAWDGKNMFFPSQITFEEAIWEVSKGRGMSIPYQPHISLMQFTGLKDKNGKEIFEGDIMQDCDVPKLFNWKVEFLDGGFKGVNIGVDGYLGQRYPLTQAMTMQREVIGNIHQNPELLK